MQKCASLKNVNKEKVVLYDKDCSHLEKGSTLPQKRRIKTFGNILEHYTITIRPKLQKSSSLSDLASNKSDFTVDLVRQTSKLLTKNKIRETIFGCSGDAVAKYYKQELTDTTYLTWNFKGKKPRRKSNNMNDCTRYGCKFTPCQNEGEPEENTSCTDNTSISSSEQINKQKGASFPFKSTPSGNLKVQSNQVVFQSSTVGVLLADPTQAKVKVKFGGPTEEQDYDGETNNDDNSELGHLNFFPQEALAEEVQSKEPLYNERCKFVPPSRRDEKGKDLSSLGYNSAEPIDWMRIQLPKKQDLLQEFYKRIHNYVNTDTIIHIGDEEYHCHRIVLQIYSGFFEQYYAPEIELPLENVTPESFQTIYEWMIFNGPDNNKGLKRENILDVFVAAQFLSIKDLEEQCWTLIVDENVFTEDSAFVLFREASRKGLIPVMDLMIPRVSKFFLPLVASKDFLDLLPEEVMAFMKSNTICVTSEIEVLMAGVRWLYGDWSQRQHLTVDIMRCVRFGLISPWQLVDIKRNPDNAEILEIVSQPEVQQMVDDGLAYVIIKYWYGNNSKIYYHWIDVLGLTEPAERNWIGEEKNHVTYKDFLKYLEQFMVPKDQIYQQMSIMQSTKRSEDAPGGCLRGLESSKLDMRRPKMDFPLPATLKGLAGDKDKDFPTMSEFIESRKKREDGGQSSSPASSPGEMGPSFMLARRRTSPETEVPQSTDSPRTRTPGRRSEQCKLSAATAAVAAAAAAPAQRPVFRSNVQQVQMCTVTHELPPNVAKMRSIDMYNEPEKESSEDRNTASSDTDKDIPKKDERRHSVAASYLAAATAALSSNRRPYRTEPQGSPDRAAQSRVEAAPIPGTANPQPQPHPQQQPQQNSSDQNSCSAHISLFNHSKESLARMNMNKLSTSILGPPNKNYVQEGSLFNWDRETVLVFGGIDPHNTYGVAKNTGQDVYRFDPVGNVWEIVGELPEPRHHHAVAFLKGRVYLVGGADPRDDDVHGKSVVVSTVWSFEPVTRSWHSEAGLSTPRKNFGLVVHRMALYAIGGQDKKGRVLRSVEKFDYKSSSWAEVRSMNIARMAIASVKYREYIWVAGGMTGDKKNPVCKTVECFNSKTNEWTQIHSLRFPRCFATMFTMNDKLYILGGAGKTVEKDKTASSVGAIDSWDWASRKWRLETEMSIPRHGHALAYLGTQLIIIGGVTTIYMRALNNVESYCCERGAWIRGVAALPSPLSGHGAVTLPPASLM